MRSSKIVDQFISLEAGLKKNCQISHIQYKCLIGASEKGIYLHSSGDRFGSICIKRSFLKLSSSRHIVCSVNEKSSASKLQIIPSLVPRFAPFKLSAVSIELWNRCGENKFALFSLSPELPCFCLFCFVLFCFVFRSCAWGRGDNSGKRENKGKAAFYF